MAEQASDCWEEVLREAIDSTPAEPMIGTRFRQAVVVAATRRGLIFPPPDEPGFRFIQMLQRYPGTLSVLRRPGQDFLVIPAERSDLLAKRTEERPFGIRQDLFRAFTTITKARAYYDVNSDSISWTNVERVGSGIPIEPQTETSEIAIRRDFIEAIRSERPESSRPLLEALDQPLALQAFSSVVKQFALHMEWHRFRTRRLLEKLQRWAAENGVAWKDAWLTEGPTNRTWIGRSPLKESEALENEALSLFLSGLDAADLQRITIPLDLVIKAISIARKA